MKQDRKEKQPDFVDGIAPVENEGGGNGHGERGEPGDVAADEPVEFEGQPDGANADEHNGQTQRPDVASEERLRKEKHVEMQRPVIIRRVVA